MFRRSQATRPRVAFALSGGCAHGAAQVGMLQALFEAHIVPDVLVGTSVGAMNAVYVAADPTPSRARELAKIWKGIGRKEVFGTSRQAVVNAIARRNADDATPEMMSKLAQLKNYSSDIPSDGGFLIPETLRSELLRVALEMSVVRPRARVRATAPRCPGVQSKLVVHRRLSSWRADVGVPETMSAPASTSESTARKVTLGRKR